MEDQGGMRVPPGRLLHSLAEENMKGWSRARSPGGKSHLMETTGVEMTLIDTSKVPQLENIKY